MLSYLLSLSHRYLAAVILRRFTVRIHTSLVQKGYSWVRLWYLLRGLDFKASGYCQLPLADICHILQCGESTVRGWLREGEWAGAFRKYSERRGEVKVILSSLAKLTQVLGLSSWGTVCQIPLFELASLGKLRAYATAAATQRMQQLSRFAARVSLPGVEQRRYKLPYPEEFFKVSDQVPSDDPQKTANKRGVLPCVLHIGAHRVFTSKGFIPYGVSQKAIALAQNYGCDRTVYRHHRLLGIQRRQVVQTKAAYSQVVRILGDESATGDRGYLSIGKGNEEIALCSLQQGAGRRSKLFEHNGRTSTQRDEGTLVSRSSFFKFWGREWIYRPNIYKPLVKLETLKARKAEYENLMNRKICEDRVTDCNKVRHSVLNTLPTASNSDSVISSTYNYLGELDVFEISESGLRRLDPAG